MSNGKNEFAVKLAQSAQKVINGFDGKKTISGLLAVIIGFAVYFLGKDFPESRETAISMISGGVLMIVVGILHKLKKYADKL